MLVSRLSRLSDKVPEPSKEEGSGAVLVWRLNCFDLPPVHLSCFKRFSHMTRLHSPTSPCLLHLRQGTSEFLFKKG